MCDDGKIITGSDKDTQNFMRSTLKWRKDLGRMSVLGGTSSLSLPEDGSLNGLNEFLVTKTVDNWVDQWCQYRVDYSKRPIKGQ